MNAELRERFVRNARLTRWAGLVLVAGMAVCAGVVYDGFAGRLFPGWALGYLPWASAIAAGMALVSESRVHRMSEFSAERFSYRLSEAVVLILLLKTGYFIHGGSGLFLEEISRYRTGLWGAFFNGEFTGQLILSLFAWLFATRMAGFTIDVTVDEEILEEGARPSMTTDRYEVRERMSGGILFYGALLIVIAVLTRADLQALWRGAPVIERGAAGVLGYFCLALVLFSLNQFSVLRGRWGWERTPIRPGIARAWLIYSGVAITIVLVAAALLPTGYSFSLFESAAVLFQLLFALAAYVFYLLMLPLLLLIAAITGEEEVRELDDPLRDLAPPPASPGEVAGTADPALWLEALRSALFWAAFIGIAVYAIVQFARQNEALWLSLRSIPLFERLAAAWRAFQRWLSGQPVQRPGSSGRGWSVSGPIRERAGGRGAGCSRVLAGCRGGSGCYCSIAIWCGRPVRRRPRAGLRSPRRNSRPIWKPLTPSPARTSAG